MTACINTRSTNSLSRTGLLTTATLVVPWRLHVHMKRTLALPSWPPFNARNKYDHPKRRNKSIGLARSASRLPPYIRRLKSIQMDAIQQRLSCSQEFSKIVEPMTPENHQRRGLRVYDVLRFEHPAQHRSAYYLRTKVLLPAPSVDNDFLV